VKIVVTGAEGMLGQALGRVLVASNVDYRPFGHSAMDVTDGQMVLDIIGEEKPDWVIHAAAFTRVDACEENPQRAFFVNAEGTRNVARSAAAVGARVLYISTDYVFDGRKGSPYTEEDRPSPINVYGESKLAGERFLSEIMPAGMWTIVRTAWLFGLGGKNFVDWIIDGFCSGRPLEVVGDQVGSPTWTVEVARAIRIIVERSMAGVYHVVNGGVASWMDLAKETLSLEGINGRLRATTWENLRKPAKRPVYSALDASKFQKETGEALLTWQEALASYLRERRLAVHK
jgi:dTDP-4-dehydrorhamnose reductase